MQPFITGASKPATLVHALQPYTTTADTTSSRSAASTHALAPAPVRRSGGGGGEAAKATLLVQELEAMLDAEIDAECE